LVSYFRWLVVILAVVGVLWVAPRLGDSVFGPIERFASRFAKRKDFALLAIALASILGRLALLPVYPVPAPWEHDEFSYLLAGDTFAHGRLTNPTHPMWLFFDTFHVLQHPTYASMYPPAQGAALALGMLLGSPWIGVVLSVALMCAAMTWMLQAWFPPKWALLGGVLVILRLDLCSYWSDSYWGGSVAAMGAALVLGAVPRIVHGRRGRDSAIMGVGAALLANSRPFEGLLFCFPVAAVLIVWLASLRGRALTLSLPRAVGPFVCVMALTALFMGYYNWRVTGSAILFPHTLDGRQHEPVPTFAWQALRPPLHYSNPQFASFYNAQMWSHTAAFGWSPTRNARLVCTSLWEFFLGRTLWLPVLTLPWLFRDRRVRLPMVQFTIGAAGLMACNWFQGHYAAPMTAAFFLLLVQAMRHLRRWQITGRPVGILLTRLVVLLALARIVGLTFEQTRNPMVDNWNVERVRLVAQIDRVPGNHLVIVRYGPKHNPGEEWVYNAADIDHSRVVWAREIPGQDLKPLLDYYRDRNVWVVEPDIMPVKVGPYQEEGN